jgi:lipoprotein-releasing system permease protein
VAALNILITLIMMVMEKNRDIAVLMPMDAKRQQLRKIFGLQGRLIGVVGTRSGSRWAALGRIADRYHWLTLNPEAYSWSYVPFTPRWHLDRGSGDRVLQTR